MSVVIVPGIWNSDERHWQTAWEQALRASGTPVIRIEPSSWDEPERDDWSAAIGRAVASLTSAVAAPGGGSAAEPIVIVAHSLGCLAAAPWLAANPGAADAAFLVAPPDPDGPETPEVVHRTFTAPDALVATPTMMVVSDDDPYCPRPVAERFAAAMGARTAHVGALGHINVASGIGGWADGVRILESFLASTGVSALPGDLAERVAARAPEQKVGGRE